MNVLVTGASGFVGRHLIDALSRLEGFTPVALVRKHSDSFSHEVKQIIITDMSSSSEPWDVHLRGIDVVIHTAARVHVMNETDSNPLQAFRDVNVDASVNLAKHAVQAGVQRFIFFSSIKVNGEITETGKPFTEVVKSVPTDPYGLSKYEAEQTLLALVKDCSMDVTIIRPPLIYGPGVKANFKSMIKWVDRQIPLPLGGLNNKRSLVAIDNLVDFTIHCLSHPNAGNTVFLVSDDDDVSTSELLRRVALVLGKQSRLITLPVSVVKTAAFLVGKKAVADRLLGSLQVDINKAKTSLDWKPITTLSDQLYKTVDSYLHEKNQ